MTSAVQAADLGGSFKDSDKMLSIEELREMTDPDNGANVEVLRHGYTAITLERTIDDDSAARDTVISVRDSKATIQETVISTTWTTRIVSYRRQR